MRFLQIRSALWLIVCILARSQEVIKGTGADQRFVKNAFKNAECHPLFL
jgi:hypothetical protein